jgi:predicted nucleic acid-binding protein
VNGYLVETNVLSELTRPSPDANVECFLRESKERVFARVFSTGEIPKGILTLPISNKRTALEEWLDNEIMPWFASRLLPVTLPIAERWAIYKHVSSEGSPSARRYCCSPRNRSDSRLDAGNPKSKTTRIWPSTYCIHGYRPRLAINLGKSLGRLSRVPAAKRTLRTERPLT